MFRTVDSEVTLSGPVYSFSNTDIDRVAVMLDYISPAEVRDELLAHGFSEVDAFLCFKAAQLLKSLGFYEGRARASLLL